MTDPVSPTSADFDDYAADYDAALAQGISVSGENKSFFARGRVAWLARCLRRLRERPWNVMDFGCGTGSSEPFLLELTGARSIVGVDVSARSLEVARRICMSPDVEFRLFDAHQPLANMDLVFTNGVFHHIRPSKRRAALDYLYRSLRRGGLCAFWENNPWNPGTRYAMSLIPFDREAILLSALEARRLLRRTGFEIIRTDFLFIFPRALRWFRPIEPVLSRAPLGAQYQVLCRKPSGPIKDVP